MDEPIPVQPRFMEFHGNIGMLIQENDTPPPSTFTPISKSDGIHVFPGVNLGHGLDPFVWDLLQPLVSKESRIYPELFSGKTGIEAQEIFDLYNATIDSANPPSLSPIDPQSFSLMAYNLYWTILKELISEWTYNSPESNSEDPISCSICGDLGCSMEENSNCPFVILGCIQTVMLWHVFDIGFRHHRHLESLIESAKSGNRQQMISMLINMIHSLDDLNPDEENHASNQRRVREILHLLQSTPLICNSVGQGAQNESEDTTRVAERLNELGYLLDCEFTVTGTTQDGQGNTINQYDFSTLDQFYQIVNQTDSINRNLLPGSHSHLRLLSSNAPRWEEVTGNLAGFNMAALTQTHTTSWMNQALERISTRYQRILRAQDGLGMTSSQDIEIQTISSNGNQFVIGLPMQSGATNPPAVTEPLYDRDAMRLILQAIVNDSLVPNSTYIHLSDPILAREGYCTLRSHDTGIVVSENHVTVRLTPPQLEFTIVAPEEIEVGEIAEPSPTTTGVSWVDSIVDFLGSKYTPDDNDGTFDYYFDAIVDNWDSGSTPPTTFPSDTVMILGIRGWSLNRWRSPTWDSWSDSIIALWIDGSNNKNFQSFFAATRPGKIRGFDNIKGDAHLEFGQYSFKFDDASNPKCLIPSSDVSIRRDPIKCGRPNENLPIEVGKFDISISAGGTNEHQVGRSSRGSQVILDKPDAGGSPFDQFMLILNNNHIGAEFIYTLIDGDDLPPSESNSGGGS